jgi:hypothetical protein
LIELPGIGSIRAIARVLMPEFVRVGVSRRGVQRLLQEWYGQAYRWAEIRKDYNEYLGLKYYQDYWNKIKPDALPKRFQFVEKDLPSGRPYYTRYYVEFENPETGERYERYVSFYTNHPISKNEALEYMEDLYASAEYEGKAVPIEIRSQEFFRQSGWVE